jgi:uncharacterized repeat protein (TIGR04052 family)
MKKIALFLLTNSLLLSACGAPTSTTNSNDNMNVKLKFKALANNQEIECGKSYENIGTSKSKVSIADFRLYISNVSLVDDKGQSVSLKLDQDKKWQNGNVALVDFENKSGDCSSGTTDINKEIKGTIAKGNYKTLKFTLGIPFEQNHQDATKAESPFNITSMFWTWNSGYKFARIDLKTGTEAKDYYIHLGSTGCMSSEMTVKHDAGHEHGDSGATDKAPTMCKNPNRPEITLNNFDIEKNTVVADLSGLLDTTDLNQVTHGCMLNPDAEGCKNITGIMNNFGLKFADIESKGQKFFRVE